MLSCINIHGIEKGIAINLSGFFSQLVAEIRRRKVLPVVVTYAVSGWLILQVAGLTFEPLGVPSWGIRVLIIVTLAGFPAVFFLAWLIDFKEKGLMFDLPLWRKDDDSPRTSTKSSQFAALTFCGVILAGTVGLVFLLLKQFPEPAPIVEIKKSGFAQNSIAVLAFENFDGNVESDYFASGLAEEILNFLAGMHELNVAARTSSFRFRGKQIDIREVATLLNVKMVLEGSVRREGDRIRMTAQLIDGENGFHIWSKTYDRKLDDIFAIQREIAAAVVNELKIALSVDSENRLQEQQTENIEAYIFYLQGREKLRSSQDADVMIVAKQLFQQALDVDPSFSRSYAGICAANLRLYEISNSVEDFSSAEQACEKAQALNKDLSSEVKVALGRLYRFRGWYEKAIEELNLAISSSPDEVDAYIELGEVLLLQSNYKQAEVAFSRAVDLKRNYWKAHEALANYYYATEQYRKSAQAYEVVTRLTPDSALGFGGLGAAYWMLGDTTRALQAYETSLQLKPSRQAYTNIGISYYYVGEYQKAVEMHQKALEFAPDDHRIWGRLAENYRFLAGKQRLAEDAYQRAAKLAQANLRINNEDWLTRAMLGLYYAHLERTKDAMLLMEIALEQSHRNPEVLYLYALVLLQQGNTVGAIEALLETIKQDDYYRKVIDQDPDLKVLKGHPDFISGLANQ
ncbi:tetratricopeptide repeat protein [Aliiglaciecola litoralis]|uniref:Tetratricopeptide repeat protein n=1 Tax=Aliiglaciecola litoralis TaxID=582857 RepID=A0ABN1LSP3_9ALTE